ncbi:MAG TPA: hypothetical protein VKU77_26545 [Streptosporangiaceae bacterium]|nr:hypothetical protein [Streptosporangiaceae bacterium]
MSDRYESRRALANKIGGLTEDGRRDFVAAAYAVCEGEERPAFSECVTLIEIIGRLISQAAGGFGDRFHICPDTGETELHCSRCSARWRVGCHPSLDALIEQARAHNLTEHGDHAMTAAPEAVPVTEPHRHSFPCQPPAGSITDPGPCECGTTYEMATATALLAAAARRVEAAGGDPVELLAGRRDREGTEPA